MWHGFELGACRLNELGVSGLGALCQAPALHRAQFKTVYNIA